MEGSGLPRDQYITVSDTEVVTGTFSRQQDGVVRGGCSEAAFSKLGRAGQEQTQVAHRDQGHYLRKLCFRNLTLV